MFIMDRNAFVIFLCKCILVYKFVISVSLQSEYVLKLTNWYKSTMNILKHLKRCRQRAKALSSDLCLNICSLLLQVK